MRAQIGIEYVARMYVCKRKRRDGQETVARRHRMRCDSARHNSAAAIGLRSEGQEKGTEQQLGGVPCEQCDANMCDIGEVRKRPETGWDTARPLLVNHSSAAAPPAGFPPFSLLRVLCCVCGTCRALAGMGRVGSCCKCSPRPLGGIIIAVWVCRGRASTSQSRAGRAVSRPEVEGWLGSGGDGHTGALHPHAGSGTRAAVSVSV